MKNLDIGKTLIKDIGSSDMTGLIFNAHKK